MKVLVTNPIPEIGINILKKKFDVTVNTETLDPEKLKELVKDKDAVLSLLTEKMNAEVMDSAPNLKVIANYAVGYNNIDVAAAKERNIVVTNTPDVLNDTTADLAFALLMAAARRIVEADKFLRAGKYKGWKPMLLLGQDIHHKTLGIVGMGRIGHVVAKRALGFDMKVIYYDAFRNKKAEEEGIEYKELDELLKVSDFVSLHVPLLPETKHMISEAQFEMMKETAVLINASRGPVVDEKALIKALQDKKIWAAGLDVFEQEPFVPKELCELDNVVMVPHIGSASVETRDAMAKLAAENIVAVLEGKDPLTEVK